MATHTDLANLIWEIANLLRGPYRPPQYERVMLPLVVLRRFDCVLADTKQAVVDEAKRREGGKVQGDALEHFHDVRNRRGFPLTWSCDS
jgi:type I restriction enzyme M protein